MEGLVAVVLLAAVLLAWHFSREQRHRWFRHREIRRRRAVRLEIVIFNLKGNEMSLLKLVKNGVAKPFDVVAVNADGDVVALPGPVVLAADFPANIDLTIDATGKGEGKGKVVSTGKFTATCANLSPDTADYEVDKDPVATAVKIVVPA